MAETTKKKTTTNKALDYLKLLQSEQSRLNKILPVVDPELVKRRMYGAKTR